MFCNSCSDVNAGASPNGEVHLEALFDITQLGKGFSRIKISRTGSHVEPLVPKFPLKGVPPSLCTSASVL